MRSEFNAVEMPEKIAMCVLPRRHIALLIFLHIRRTEFIVRRGAAGDHAGRTNCKRTFPESFLFRQASSETLLYPNSSAARFAFAPLELKTTLSGQDARRFIEHHRDCPAGSRPMAKPRELRFNAFNMTAPSHNWAGLWSHPRDTSINYNSLDYWVDYARTAERGLLDGIFLADVFGVYDVFGDSPDTAIRHAVQLPNAEPTLLVSAMALATKHLGFGITSNLTFEHPYQLARRFSTLDHLTNGRIGWNIVTGYLDSGARGMGLPASRVHDERYDAAEDFLEASYKLWEGSWEDGAVVRDREDDLCTRRESVYHGDVERRLLGPADRPAHGGVEGRRQVIDRVDRTHVGRGSSPRRTTEPGYSRRRQAEGLVKEVQISLNRWAAEGVDDDDRLARPIEALFSRRRREPVRLLEEARRVAGNGPSPYAEAERHTSGERVELGVQESRHVMGANRAQQRGRVDNRPRRAREDRTYEQQRNQHGRRNQGCSNLTIFPENQAIATRL